MTTIFKISFLIFSTFIFFLGNAQTVDETIEFADQQYAQGNYDIALNSYRRAIFFNTDADPTLLYLKIGHVNSILENFEEALFNYEMAYNTSSNDSISNEILFLKCQIYIAIEKYGYAKQELLNVKSSQNQYFNRKQEFYTGIIELYNQNLDKSKDHFLNSVSQSDSVLKEKIILIFAENNRMDKPNPKTAKLLSIIFPGLGQLYAGDYKTAINSFVLTGGLAVLFFYVSGTYSLADGVVSVLPWFQRYYLGGYENAEKIAIQIRHDKKNQLYQEILMTFVNNAAF